MANVEAIFDKMLDYIETSSKATKVAEELLAKQQEKQASADLIESVIADLRKANLLKEGQESLARTKLSDPSSALEVLQNVITSYKQASARAAAAASDLGKPEKVASYDQPKKSQRDAALLALIDRR